MTETRARRWPESVKFPSCRTRRSRTVALRRPRRNTLLRVSGRPESAQLWNPGFRFWRRHFRPQWESILSATCAYSFPPCKETILFRKRSDCELEFRSLAHAFYPTFPIASTNSFQVRNGAGPAGLDRFVFPACLLAPGPASATLFACRGVTSIPRSLSASFLPHQPQIQKHPAPNSIAPAFATPSENTKSRDN